MPLLALLLASNLASATVPPLPSPQPQATTETRFGITVEDPDRWLEDQRNPAAQQWVKAQANHTRALLDAIPARAEVLADIERLEKTTASALDDLVVMPGERLLLRRIAAGEDVAKLWLREGWEGNERMLLDPASYKRKPDASVAINYAVPSPDGKRALVGLSESGSEQASLHVIDLASGKSLEAPIPDVNFGASWLPDSLGFFYNRENPLGPGTPVSERQLNSQAYFHRLGSKWRDDAVVFGNRYDKALGIDAAQFPNVSASVEHDWLVAIPYSVDRKLTIFIAPRADLARERIGWRRVVTRDDDVSAFVEHRDGLYLLSAKEPTRRIERLAFAAPDANRDVVVPAGLLPIDALGDSDDALFYTVKRDSGVGSQLYRMPWKAKVASAVTLPVERVNLFGALPGARSVAAFGMGWAAFPTVLRIDADGQVHETTLQPEPAGVDASQLVSTVVEVPSHDGVKVPLSIVHHRNLARDGSHPALLQAYGAYGISTEPGLVAAHFAYFERGFVRAFCHVRGGGEKGEAWYRAGYQATKANTWKDFNACAEYLVAHKYTSAKTLGALGGSAGGILIGNAMLERPDLYAAMMPSVGVLDSIGAALRDPNGPVNWPEFGDPNSEDGWKALVGMSAYQKVKDGTAYPAVMLPHGYHDPRVAVWHSAKFAARLQRASSSGKPVLLNVDYDAGHGIGSTQTTINHQRADLISFMLWQFGVEGFEPQVAAP